MDENRTLNTDSPAEEIGTEMQPEQEMDASVYAEDVDFASNEEKEFSAKGDAKDATQTGPVMAEISDDVSEPLQRFVAEDQPRKRRKGRTGHVIGIVALALVCTILGSAVGGLLVGSVMQTRMNAELEAFREAMITTSGSHAEADKQASKPMEQLSSELKTNVGDKSLTPSEVYDAYVGSIVGIANEGTMTNYFGQVSATASSGSGFILTEDGYIVTNYHVIEYADKLTVTLNNEEKYEAAVVGYDSGNDIALIKIDAEGLKPVSAGNSDLLRVGETVCAIGNPLGELTNTLTIGVVSALDREVNTDGTPINMMQTDCAINAGNSGGPLFDMNGNVIGITTAKYYGGTIEGIGFAIPINDALEIVADLREYGYVTGQPYMGITVMDMNASTAEMYRLPVGVFVDSVEAGSCAEKAGMEEGDIIIALGEYEVRTMTEMLGYLKNFAAGDTTTIKVYRAGQELTLTITFDEKKPAYEIPAMTQEG